MLPVDDLPALLEEALRATAPQGALQKLAARLLELGAERGDLLPALEHFHAGLLADGRAADAEQIAGMIDGFTGWCRLDE